MQSLHPLSITCIQPANLSVSHNEHVCSLLYTSAPQRAEDSDGLAPSPMPCSLPFKQNSLGSDFHSDYDERLISDQISHEEHSEKQNKIQK